MCGKHEDETTGHGDVSAGEEGNLKLGTVFQAHSRDNL